MPTVVVLVNFSRNTKTLQFLFSFSSPFQRNIQTTKYFCFWLKKIPVMFEICSVTKDQNGRSMPFPTVKLSKKSSPRLTGEERNLP